MNTLLPNNQYLSLLGQKYNEQFFRDVDNSLRQELNTTGILLLPNFISPQALTELQAEAALLKPKAYQSTSEYNLYVLPDDVTMPENSPRNKKFKTSKSCIADDQLPENSLLRTIYDTDLFRTFICKLQGLAQIFPYADALSSININYYDTKDSLEWHFDNSDFAITLLIKQCDEGGIYEYVPNIRYDKNGQENYELLEKILGGSLPPKQATMRPGDLMIFRGNQSLHRVTPVEKGDRILVTLNYNVKPGIPLSEKSRLTFFGRT